MTNRRLEIAMWLLGVTAVAPALSACSGNISREEDRGEGDRPGRGDPGDNGSDDGIPEDIVDENGEPVEVGDPYLVGTHPLRRLTRNEYDNTIRELLGDDTRPARAFPAEVAGSSGFDTAVMVTGVEVARFREAAEAVATRAMGRLSSLLPCDPADGEEACARQFVTRFGKRAFRRPLSPAESDALMGLYAKLRAAPIQHDFNNAIRVVIAAVLQSPQFLYHWQQGDGAPTVDGEAVRLGPYEVASRLSYLLWQTMPDDDLFAAADEDRLDAQALEAHARRMLKDERARDTVVSFHEQSLELHALSGTVKDPKIYPEWTPQLASDLHEEFQAFVAHAVLEDGKLETLLTAPYSFLNKRLAQHYGVSGPSGDAFVKTMMPGRSGLLTQGAFLSVAATTYETSPVKRGKVVREKLLCHTVPPPPPGVDITTPNAAAAGVSTREAYRVHQDNPGCSSCHLMMDPLGFALEGFDGIGRKREMDAGKPVDATGVITGIDGGDVTYDGAEEFASSLVNLPEVRRCIPTLWLRYALGREYREDDKPSLAGLISAFSTSDFDIRELLVGLVKSRAFRFRAPAPGEVL